MFDEATYAQHVIWNRNIEYVGSDVLLNIHFIEIGRHMRQLYQIIAESICHIFSGEVEFISRLMKFSFDINIIYLRNKKSVIVYFVKKF